MERSGSAGSAVVAIECVAGSSRADEWDGCNGEAAAPLCMGDILEEITFGGSLPARAPFKGGRDAVMKLLHAAFQQGDVSVLVRARRGERSAVPYLELHASIVFHPPAGRRQFLLRSIRDPNYAIALVDRSVSECIALQGSLRSRVVCALASAQLKEGYISFPWEGKVRDSLSALRSTSSLSPHHPPQGLGRLRHKLQLARGHLGSRQRLAQLLPGRRRSHRLRQHPNGGPSYQDPPGDCFLHREHGSTDRPFGLVCVRSRTTIGWAGAGVVRAVRLWNAPTAGEMALEIRMQEGDTRLGFAISRTEEVFSDSSKRWPWRSACRKGFIYISSVTDDDSAGASAARTRLRELYKRAARASKLLVVLRVENEKVLPWMVSTSGAISCFDTVSLSQKLSLHRHALKPILLHLFMWDASASAVPRVVEQHESPALGCAGGSTAPPQPSCRGIRRKRKL